MTALAAFSDPWLNWALIFAGVFVAIVVLTAAGRSVRPEPPAVHEPASNLSDPHTRPEPYDWEGDV